MSKEIRAEENPVYSAKATVPENGDILQAKLVEELAQTLLNNEAFLKAALDKVGKGVSHVGQVIFSTTLDTQAKVINIYGGTSWEQIKGRFPLGVSESYPNGKTGGEETHTLTEDELPEHNHTQNSTQARVGPCTPYSGGSKSLTVGEAASGNIFVYTYLQLGPTDKTGGVLHTIICRRTTLCIYGEERHKEKNRHWLCWQHCENKRIEASITAASLDYSEK